MSDLTVQERIERGRTAARLLEDPVLSEAIRDAEDEAVRAFLDADRFDPETARTAYAVRLALSLIHDSLRRKLSDGQMAAEGQRRAL